MSQATDRRAARDAARVRLSPEPANARVYLRRPSDQDAHEFLALMRRSRDLHHPWLQPPLGDDAFRQYLTRMDRVDHEGFLVCRGADDAIAGVINLNNIVHGAFLSASLGYYAGAGFHGVGLMTEGLAQVIRVAFESLGLHRIEANIQPDNAASIALVRRLGFRREGFSPRYLFINGAWRDHERWALVDHRERLLPPGVPFEVVHRMP